MSTKRFMQIMVVMAAFASFGPAPVFAEEMGCPGCQGMTGRDHMGGMGRRRGMMGKDMMDKKMQELQHHEKMMEGVKDRDQLIAEMKKHMQMMTNMMEDMMRQPESAPRGSEGTPDRAMPEHPMDR
jgi:hypothetical protein